MANSVSGVGTINVAKMVNQLMSVEGNQQILLKQKAAAQQSAITALQSINSGMLNLKTLSEGIIGAGVTAQPWNNLAGTSSDTSISVTAGTGAQAGTYNVTVDQLATAQQTTYATSVAMADKVAAAATLVISGAAGTPPTTVNVGTGTLSEVVAAINAAPAAGVSATAVQIAPGQFKLLLTSKVTGSSGGFSVTGMVDDSQLVNATVAQDAKVTVPGIGQITSTSNTFQNVFPGVTFTVTKPATTATLTVANDATGMTSQVQKLVDALNSVLTTISAKSAYDTTNKKAGPLTGSPVATSLSDQLSDAVFSPTPGDSLSQIGIQTTRQGTYSFDASAFTAKLNSDPDSAQRLVEGLATRLQAISSSVTRIGTGQVSIAIDGGNSVLKTLNDQVADWDLRLADMRASYTRQFSALNTTLAKMQDQQSWLANQFSTMSAG